MYPNLRVKRVHLAQVVSYLPALRCSVQCNMNKLLLVFVLLGFCNFAMAKCPNDVKEGERLSIDGCNTCRFGYLVHLILYRVELY